MSALLTYALNETNELVHIDSVLKGGACKCKCPLCGNWLDAKNGGNIREHHFAHSHGSVCEGAYETTLHLLAKQVLQEEKALMLPPSEDETRPTGYAKLINVDLEKWDSQYGFKPDAEGILEDGRRLLIEFYVSHKVQKKKHETIVKNNLLCIEINLNFIELDKDAIRKFLLENTEYREWLTKIENKVSHEDNLSLSYGRNKWHAIASDFIKSLFEKDSLKLVFGNYYYDLKSWAYDVCEKRSKNFRGVRSDLLLYRSKKKDKGYISINFRGRRRNYGQKLPENLRIIDIIIKDENDFNWLTSLTMLQQDNNKIFFERFNYKDNM